MPKTSTIPRFVKLTAHMQFGCQHDIATGFGISGRDVKPVPDNANVHEYVKQGLRKGLFEEATEEEYEEVTGASYIGDDIPKVIMIDPTQPIPENILRASLSQLGAGIEQRAADREESLVKVTESTPANSYARLSEQDLRSILSGRGIDSSGSKASLVSKLQASDAANAAPEDETEDDEEDEYTSWSLKALKAECKDRGLPRTGTIAELAARLEENDAEDDGEEDEENPES